MECREQAETHSAEDHIMKMPDNKIGVMELHIGRKRSEEKPGKAADGKEKDERKRIEKRRLYLDRTLIHCGEPVEHLDRAGNGDKKCEK